MAIEDAICEFGMVFTSDWEDAWRVADTGAKVTAKVVLLWGRVTR
jgi:hypothetical protein